jgi:membrane-bound serine protease (ClpP class)
MGTGLAIALIILLTLVAMVLILFELLTPTFGPLAATGLAALVAAVWVGFTVSGTVGGVLIFTYALGVPLYVIVLIRHLPRTRAGRKLFLEQSPDATGAGTPDAAAYGLLVGKTGVAVTILRPSGAVRVEGQRIIAQAETGVIDAGTTVKVISTDGTTVIVRAVRQES